MIKYFFNTIILLVATFNLCGQQKGCSSCKTYLYCVNDSFSLSIGTFLYMGSTFSHNTSSFSHSLDAILDLYGIWNYSYWFDRQFFIDSKLENPTLYNRYILKNDIKVDTFGFQENGIAFYNWYGHLSHVQGDVFIIKQNGKYFYDYYISHHIVHHIQNKIRMVSIDSVYSDYKMYNYEISNYNHQEKVDEKPYLHIKFCPKMGIVSYTFLKPNIKIALQYIDGIPIDYYIKNNICLTPFCEID